MNPITLDLAMLTLSIYMIARVLVPRGSVRIAGFFFLWQVFTPMRPLADDVLLMMFAFLLSEVWYLTVEYK